VTEHLDAAWALAGAADDATHSARVTSTERLVIRSLDWAMVEGLPEQTWSTPLAPGDHDLRLLTSRIGSTATRTGGLVADILLAGDLHGEPPLWERAGPDMPFRRGLAIVPDLAADDPERPSAPLLEVVRRGASRTAVGLPWDEALRALETFPVGDRGELHLAIAVFPVPFWERRSDTGQVMLAATPCAAVPRSPVRPTGEAWELVTHGSAERWIGRRNGSIVAVAFDIGSGIRRTLDAVELIEDPWLRPIGAPIVRTGIEAGEVHVSDPEGDPADWMPYTDAFVPARHPSGRAATASIGEVRFPSGVATVVNPTSPELATDLVVDLPRDRSLPSFLAPTFVSRYADLMVRIGDTPPVEWRSARLRAQAAAYGHYGRGLIALCDRSIAQRMRDDAGYARRISELAFSLSPMILRSGIGDDPLGVVIRVEGDIPVLPLLGIDAAGAITAVALNAADASDVSGWDRSA
jgi:hypothetical protein